MALNEVRESVLRCPNCQVAMRTETREGIEVEQWPQCNGLWLDYAELDLVEDRAFADDHAKATLVYDERSSSGLCPRCSTTLHAFNYRGWNLELQMCEAQHGFWLDAGEDERILELMRQRQKDLDRSATAEEQWGQFVSGLKSRSFAQKSRGVLDKLRAPAPDRPSKLVLQLPWRKRFVLFWRLFRDGRVPFLAKLVIPGILFYLALPFDVIPDFVPFIGFIDDLFVAILGLWLFLRLTPRAIFDEHIDRLGAEIEEESRRR